MVENTKKLSLFVRVAFSPNTKGLFENKDNKNNKGQQSLNVFLKPNEQNEACFDSAMARKGAENEPISSAITVQSRFHGQMVSTRWQPT